MFVSSSRRLITLILLLGFTGTITGCNSGSRKEENSKPAKTGAVAKDGIAKENPSNNKSPANQAPVTAGNSTAHPYVTNNCQAAIILHPRKIYQSALLQEFLKSGATKTFVDNELVGQLINTLGFDVREIIRFSFLVTSLPSKPREAPSLVMVLEFTEADDRSKIISDLIQLDAPVEQDGKQWYLPKDASSGPVVCVPNNKTVVFSTDLDLARQVVTTPAAKNPLNARLVELDYQNQAGVIVGQRDLFPPALMAEMQGEVRREELPPAFAEVPAIMAELRTASMVLNLSPDLYLELDVTTSSEENTTKLKTMINDSLTLLKSTLGVLTLAPPREIPQSMRLVLQQILKLLAQIELRQSNSRLAVTMKVPPRQLMALQGPLEQFLVSVKTKTPKIPDLHVVQGKVTLDGKPLADARVALHRSGPGASRVFAANTNSEGLYNIQALYTSGEFTGAPAGHYKVTVIKVSPSELSDEEFARQYQQEIEAATVEGKPDTRSAPPYLVNPQYVSTRTTPFEIEVRTGNNNYNFSLTSEPPLKK